MGLKIFNVEEIETHGGSIRVYVSQEKVIKVSKNFEDLLKHHL